MHVIAVFLLSQLICTHNYTYTINRLISQKNIYTVTLWSYQNIALFVEAICPACDSNIGSSNRVNWAETVCLDMFSCWKVNSEHIPPVCDEDLLFGLLQRICNILHVGFAIHIPEQYIHIFNRHLLGLKLNKTTTS